VAPKLYYTTKHQPDRCGCLTLLMASCGGNQTAPLYSFLANMMMGNCGVARPTAAHPNEAQPIAAQFFFFDGDSRAPISGCQVPLPNLSQKKRCHCPMNKCSRRHGKAIYTLHIVIPLPEGFASRSEKQISPNNILYQPTSISRFF